MEEVEIEALNGSIDSIYSRCMKRIIDAVLGSVLIVGTLPLWILASMLIFIESPGNVLFVQERVGWRRKRFRAIKFRTMIPGADRNGPSVTGENDGRVLKVGKLLRKFRIDELPQLVNVVKGDMSLIGPRAEPVEVVEENGKLPGYDLRFLIRPGISGLSQVTIGYVDSNDGYKEKLKYDLEYIKGLSFRLDFNIFLRTIWVVASGKGR